MRWHIFVVTAAFTILCQFAAVAVAENEGQDQLDQATLAKLEAKTLTDLGKVIDLCEQALQKGLNEGNTEFAHQLLTSTLTQRGTFYTKPVLDRSPPSPQWQQLRKLALADFQRAVDINPSIGDAQMLIARLQVLPGGDRRLAVEAADSAIKAFADAEKPRDQSKALTLRGRMQEDTEKRMADFSEAIKLDPLNTEPLRMRGMVHVQNREFEKGLADLTKVLELDSEDVQAHQAAAEALTSMEKFDEALEHLNKSIDLDDKTGAGYVLRARLKGLQGELDDAIDDLDLALEKNPRSLPALLMRAELRGRNEQYEQARGDVDRVLRIRPGLPQAILLRSGLYAAEGKYAKAIGDLEQLAARDETNMQLRLQIAALLVADSRPRKAIEVYSTVLENDPEDLLALRGRADAMLSVGKQKEAIGEYESLLKLDPDNNGALNNLAWVLATSPDETIRDADRSIKLAEKACEVTEYKAAHILSTLAAGYAEKGDYNNAKKWAKKAIKQEQEEGEQLKQLKAELQSYKEKKPWRELQNVEEKSGGDSPPSDFEL